jgi:hypothetical protein
MKVEQAKQIASNAIEQLRQALEEGHSGRLREYLAAMARFHRYSLHNIFLIASQKPKATHVAGFHAWHKLGRFVKKGEKGIMILAPVIRKKAENNTEVEPDESTVAVGFRAAYVFDISQTDGQPLPEIGTVNGDPCGYRERLGKFVADQAIALEYSDEIAPARGMSEGGKITLLPGQSPAATASASVSRTRFVVLVRRSLRCIIAVRWTYSSSKPAQPPRITKFSTPSARMIHPCLPSNRGLPSTLGLFSPFPLSVAFFPLNLLLRLVVRKTLNS